jgi:hypothetical protein
MLTFGTSYTVAPEVVAIVAAVEKISAAHDWSSETVLLGPAEYFALRHGEHQMLVCIEWNVFGGLILGLYAAPEVYTAAPDFIAALSTVDARVIDHKLDGGLNYRSEWEWLQRQDPTWLVESWREQKAVEQRSASTLLLLWANLQAVDLVAATINRPHHPSEESVIVDPQFGEYSLGPFRNRVGAIHGIHSSMTRLSNESTNAFIQRAHSAAYRAIDHVGQALRERMEHNERLQAIRNRRQSKYQVCLN